MLLWTVVNLRGIQLVVEWNIRGPWIEWLKYALKSFWPSYLKLFILLFFVAAYCLSIVLQKFLSVCLYLPNETSIDCQIKKQNGGLARRCQTQDMRGLSFEIVNCFVRQIWNCLSRRGEGCSGGAVRTTSAAKLCEILYRTHTIKIKGKKPNKQTRIILAFLTHNILYCVCVCVSEWANSRAHNGQHLFAWFRCTVE